MSEISGIYRDGHIELTGSVDWPDGTPVTVQPWPVSAPQSLDTGELSTWGMNEDEYEDTPEFRKKLIAQMNSFEPLERTAQEEAEWQAARQWIKEHTLAAVRTQMGLEP